MRQIIAFFLSWRGVIGFFKQMACAIILSLCYSMAAADSSAISPSPADKSSMPTHTVVIGDTLWNVAIRLRPDNMPMAQAMDILYESNPDAFLEGDSTKLIEGSVVAFPASITAAKAPDIVVSQENAILTIPQIDALEEPIIETTELLSEEHQQKSDVVDSLPLDKRPQEAEYAVPDSQISADEEVMPDSANPDQPIEQELEELPIDNFEAVDSVPLNEASGQDKSPQVMVDVQPAVQPNQKLNIEINQPLQVKSVNQNEQFLAQLKSENLNRYMDKVRQLPIDIWFFLVAFMVAILINRTKRKSSTFAVQKKDPLVESVLDGPFAEGDDQDDVFIVDIEQPAEAKFEDKKQTIVDDQAVEEIDIDLPGLEELKAQLGEDGDQTRPLAKDYETVSFDEDTLEIDPLQIKLDMASLCIEMGDIESAQSILEEIISEADKQGKAKAREILNSIET